MERILRAQASRDDSRTVPYTLCPKTLEINPQHSIMMELKKQAEAEHSDRHIEDLIWLLFDSALLASGSAHDEQTQFAGRIHSLIKVSLGIDDDEGHGHDHLPPLEVDGRDAKEELSTEIALLIKLVKEVLGNTSGPVVVSDCNVKSPCVFSMAYMESEKILKINPKHSIIMELAKKAVDKSDKMLQDLIWLLFDAAVLTSGYNLVEPTQFAARIFHMIELCLGIENDCKDIGGVGLPEVQCNDAMMHDEGSNDDLRLTEACWMDEVD